MGDSAGRNIWEILGSGAATACNKVSQATSGGGRNAVDSDALTTAS